MTFSLTSILNISIEISLLAEQAATELSPVCAIVGGVLAQDILKVVQGKELPLQNWFIYNGMDGKYGNLLVDCDT